MLRKKMLPLRNKQLKCKLLWSYFAWYFDMLACMWYKFKTLKGLNLSDNKIASHVL
jgi:hypothetical protein